MRTGCREALQEEHVLDGGQAGNFWKDEASKLRPQRPPETTRLPTRLQHVHGRKVREATSVHARTWDRAQDAGQQKVELGRAGQLVEDQELWAFS